jgi:hypothetical protein
MAYTNIDDPSAHFQVKTYTGTSNIHDVTLDGNSDMQPDWVWFKNRDVGYVHQLYDSSRGVTKALYSNGTNAEATISNGLTRFDPDGFRVTSAAAINEDSIVCWNWKANGGTTASNTDGTLTGGATVQANTDAGFSIITYTGTSQTNPTVGHGLNQAPELVIVKNRDLARNWAVGSTAIGWTKYLALDTNGAAVTNSGWWGNQDPTSTTVGLGTGTQTAGNTYDYVMYAFHSVQGYSKFGSYIGNGESLNGPFVYTGFKPAWVMLKNADNVNGRNWYIYDDTRRTFNPNGTVIRADTDGTEITDQAIDVLSNGFKVKPSAIGSYGTSNINHSGQEIIYMAFAKNPFVTSTGIPTTAR